MAHTRTQTLMLMLALLTCAGVAHSQSLLTNGGFDAGSKTGWTSPAAFALNQADTQSGGHDILYAGQLSDQSLYQAIQATGGKTYTLTAYYRVDQASVSAAGWRYAEIGFYPGSGPNWGNTLASVQINDNATTNGWVQVSVQYRPAANQSLAVGFVNWQTDAIYGLDSFTLDDGSGTPDDVPPAAITTLATGAATANSVVLNWTAVGDDGTTGTATTYDVRYSASTITEANWAAATQVAGEPIPKSAGSSEQVTVAGLQPQTTYFFAVRVADDGDNWSGLSNVVSAATLEGSGAVAGEWHQHAFNAQHTSFNPQSVATPWRWKWSWNGPNATGGVTSGKTSLPRNVQPVTGGGRVYVARGSAGVVALNEANGAVLWSRNPGSNNCNATCAYDPASDRLYVTNTDGRLYILDAANGQTAASFNTNAGISTPPCLLNDRVLVASGNRVHALKKDTLERIWTYDAGAATQTPPTYSASRNRVIVCTADLYVHAIDNAAGRRVWRVKPSPRTAASDVNFTNGWPVVAEVHGLVLVKMRLDWDTMWTWSPWPITNEAIRANLVSRPDQQALFALSLDDGSVPFICNIGHGGYGDGGYLPMGPQPVVKRFQDGSEVVYTMIRGKQGGGADGRWDTNFGEMVLDGATVPGLLPGYIRWIQWDGAVNNGGKPAPTDEQPNVSMAGDDLFGGHWMAGMAIRITDRSASRGSFASPVVSQNLPHFITSTNAVPFSPTHWDGDGLLQDGDARTFPGGFYIYHNQGTVYDRYWSEYAVWVVSGNSVYYRSNDGAIIALENGDPTAVGLGEAAPTPDAAPRRTAPREATPVQEPRRLEPRTPAQRRTPTIDPAAMEVVPVIHFSLARQHAGEVRTVEGRLRYVFNNGKTILLGFADPHFGSFKVQIPRECWDAFGAGLGTAMGRDGAGLYREGQALRVTGTIEWYQGDPVIYARTPGQIIATDPMAGLTAQP